MKLRLIIAGGRDFDDYELLERECLAFIAQLSGVMYFPKKEDITCISGGAAGADYIGERFADYHRFNRKNFAADWEGLKYAAGPIRNKEMATYATEPEFIRQGNICGLIAFWDGDSPGTASMIDIAKKQGIKTKIVIY